MDKTTSAFRGAALAPLAPAAPADATAESEKVELEIELEMAAPHRRLNALVPIIVIEGIVIVSIMVFLVVCISLCLKRR